MSDSHPQTMDVPLPTLRQIEEASQLIRRHVPPTPCYQWPLLQQAAGCELWLKHENHTPLGAFKIRGGLVYLDEILHQQPRLAGVIAASTGNHGQSIAFAARVRGIRAVIVVPHGNNREKNAAIQALGGELVEYGKEFQEALEYSRVLAQEQQLHAVPSFHPWLVRGVATYGLELLRAVPQLDAIYVPIGMGSGICGLAAARAAVGLYTKLIGVVAEESPAYAQSFRQAKVVVHPSGTRVSEGVACSTPDPLALEWMLRNVHDVVTVTDQETLDAMRDLLEYTHNLAEGAGAVAWAAVKKSKGDLPGKRIACVMSGGNASLTRIREAIGP